MTRYRADLICGFFCSDKLTHKQIALKSFIGHRGWLRCVHPLTQSKLLTGALANNSKTFRFRRSLRTAFRGCLKLKKHLGQKVSFPAKDFSTYPRNQGGQNEWSIHHPPDGRCQLGKMI
jgi:hypothetical protein